MTLALGAAAAPLTSSVQPPLPDVAAAPSAEDVAKFDVAFSPPRGVTIEQLGAAPIDPGVVDPAASTPGEMGERILASVERMREGYKDGMGRLDATMRQKDIRSPDMMRLFVDTMQMSLQQDLLSKIVGRSTQNLDTLLKGQ